MKKLISDFFQSKHFDKALHFAAGFGISGVVYAAGAEPFFGFMAACIAGVGKEHYDRKQGGRFDKLDILATVAGAALHFGLTHYF